VNQLLSNLSAVLGWKVSPSRLIGEEDGCDLCLGVRQCINSVVGTENPTPNLVPLALRID